MGYGTRCEEGRLVEIQTMAMLLDRVGIMGFDVVFSINEFIYG